VTATDDNEWERDAACRGYPEDLWFSELSADTRRAVAICDTCPVRRPCLDDAMVRNEVWGVWGGTTQADRAALRRRDVGIVCGTRLGRLAHLAAGETCDECDGVAAAARTTAQAATRELRLVSSTPDGALTVEQRRAARAARQQIERRTVARLVLADVRARGAR
jgi:WhiB family redox-sensing transcriptional regulator